MSSTNDINIFELCTRAETCLESSKSLVSGEANKIIQDNTEYVNWELFLDQESQDLRAETCAVACGISILTTCGVSSDSTLLKPAKRMLEYLKLPDGGWTSYINMKDLTRGGSQSTTLDTYYSISALLQLGEFAGAEIIKDGLQRLKDIQNPKDGGWGFFRDDKSRVITTSYVVRLFSEANKHLNSEYNKIIIDRGVRWLLDAKNSDGVWGRDSKGPSSAVHTSLVIIALIASGFDKFSSTIRNANDWLLKNAEERNSIVDSYEVPKRDDKGNIVGGERRIDHVNFAEGIILQGLLKTEIDLLNPSLVRLMTDLITSQKDGYWKTKQAAYERPIYSIMDGVFAIKEFIDKVRKNEVDLRISNRLNEISRKLTSQQSQIASVNEEIANIKNDVSGLKTSLRYAKVFPSLFNKIKTYKFFTAFAISIVAYWIIRTLNGGSFTFPLGEEGEMNITSDTLAIFWNLVLIGIGFLKLKQKSEADKSGS